MRFTKQRYVYSAEYKGLMLQRYSEKEQAWRDWSSAQEGELPVNDARAKRIVKWSNLRLRKEFLEAQAKLAHQKYLDKLSKVYAVEKKMAELTKKISVI
jgi:hypothetical protein